MVPKKAPISSIIFGISYQFMLDLLALLLPKYSDGQPNHAIELKGWKNNQNDQILGCYTKKTVTKQLKPPKYSDGQPNHAQRLEKQPK